MEVRFGRLRASLRQIVVPLAVFVVALQAFQIMLMPWL